MLVSISHANFVSVLWDGATIARWGCNEIAAPHSKMSSRQTHVTYKAATVAKDVMMSGGHRKDSVRFPSGVKSAYVVPSEAFKDDFLMKINEGNLVKCDKIIW